MFRVWGKFIFLKDTGNWGGGQKMNQEKLKAQIMNGTLNPRNCLQGALTP